MCHSRARFGALCYLRTHYSFLFFSHSKYSLIHPITMSSSPPRPSSPIHPPTMTLLDHPSTRSPHSSHHSEEQSADHFLRRSTSDTSEDLTTPTSANFPRDNQDGGGNGLIPIITNTNTTTASGSHTTTTTTTQSSRRPTPFLFRESVESYHPLQETMSLTRAKCAELVKDYNNQAEECNFASRWKEVCSTPVESFLQGPFECQVKLTAQTEMDLGSIKTEDGLMFEETCMAKIVRLAMEAAKSIDRARIPGSIGELA